MRLPPCSNRDSIYIQTAEDVVFYLDFCGFLPGEFGSWCELVIRIPGCSCALCILQLYVKNVLSVVALQHCGRNDQCELVIRIPGCSCTLCILQLYVKNVLSLVALQHHGLM